MRKTTFCLIFTAIMAASAGVAEETGFHVTVSSIIDGAFVRRPFGDYAEKEATGGGSPYPYQGQGRTRFFQSSLFDESINALVKFAYAGEHSGGLLSLKGSADSAYSGPWDWEVWARLFGSHLRLAAGNQAQYSGVPAYMSLSDFVLTKIDTFGVLYPVWEKVPMNPEGAGNVAPAFQFPYGYDTPGAAKGFASFASTAQDDLFMSADGFPMRQNGFMASLTFEPVTISAATVGLFERNSLPFANPWYENTGGVLPTHDNVTEPLLVGNTNSAFRVETGIGPYLRAAAVYKYSGRVLRKTEVKPGQTGSAAKLDERRGSHAFGVYANARLDPLVRGLGISAGYSGLLQTWTNGTEWKAENNQQLEEHGYSSKKEAVFPLYTGLDLRLQYTGVPRLRLSLANNVSFARMRGTKDYANEWVAGWAYGGSGEGGLNENAEAASERREDYLGLYNSLAVQYTLSGAVSLDAQAANRFGLFTLNWEQGRASSSTDSLGFYLGASYTRRGRVNVTVSGGLASRINAFSTQEAGAGDVVHKAGWLDFGVPLGLKVEF